MLAQENLHRQGAVDIGGSLTPVGTSTGFVVAVDTTTGKILWKTPRSAPMLGGTMVTASNLVFTGGEDGYFYAFDATNGKILWRANLGLGFGAPPITYMVNGVQYVAVATGSASGAAFAGSKLKPGGTFVVFKLNGGPIHKMPVVNVATVPASREAPSIVGLKKINPWEYVDTTRQRVVMTLTAAATPNNNGFNFDGYAKGGTNFIVPAGWTVDWIFSNKSSIPHSAAVSTSNKPAATATVFGLSPIETPNPREGTPANTPQYLSFNATVPGKFYLVCLVPGHIQSGMWDVFTVSTTAKMPSIQTTSP